MLAHNKNSFQDNSHILHNDNEGAELTYDEAIRFLALFQVLSMPSLHHECSVYV